MNWQLKEDIRKMIDFRTMNLIEPWPAGPTADVILLRNVLIYFDVASKKEILAKVRRLMHPDGYLLLGGAESTLNLDDAFKRIELEKSSFYRLH
jgi:chemotaxis protein methyltransferase CheR